MSLNSTEGISLNFHWWYDLGDRLMGLKGRGQIRHTIRREKLRDFMSSNWVEVPDIFCFEFDFCSLIDPGCFFLSPTVISLIALVCRQLHNCSLLSHKQLMSGPTSSYNWLRTWMFCRCRRYTWLKSCQFLIDIRHSHSATGERQSEPAQRRAQSLFRPITDALSGVSIQRNARNAMNATNVQITSSSQ